MNRPRIAAVISGVVASTATFVVSSRYNLAGTVAGAAVAPVIYTLVSHGANQGVETLGKRVRGRWPLSAAGDEAGPQGEGAGRAPAGDPPDAGPAVPTVYAVGDPTQETIMPSAVVNARVERGRGWSSGQWWLAGLACMAIVMSIYAVATSGGTTVVRQTVIQKVTATTDKKASTSGKSASASTTTAAADGTTTTVTTEKPTTTTQASDTTTTSDTAAGGGSSSVTTSGPSTSTQ